MSRAHRTGFKPIGGLAKVFGMQSRTPMFALVLIGVQALGLAGCGRKGELDLPPSATAQPAADTEPGSVMSPIERPSKPQPRVVPDRRLPIDVLLE